MVHRTLHLMQTAGNTKRALVFQAICKISSTVERLLACKKELYIMHLHRVKQEVPLARMEVIKKIVVTDWNRSLGITKTGCNDNINM